MYEIFTTALLCYLVLFFLGSIFFILFLPLFKGLSESGYTISKILGLLLPAYSLLLLGSLKIPFVGYKTITLVCVLLFFALMAAYQLYKNFQTFQNLFNNKGKFILMFEGMSFICFLFLVFIKSFSPDISGTNKLADLSILSGLLQTDCFPSHDILLSGFSLNYYYLGHLCFSIPIKLLGVDPATGFNLIAPMVFLLLLQSIFCLMVHLTGKVPSGILSLVFIFFLSNFEPLRQIFTVGLANGFNWWNEAHFITPYFIESPYWSFVLGSVHTHFLAMPFLSLYFCLSFLWITNVSCTPRHLIILNVLRIFTLSTVFMMNIWFYAILLLFELIILANKFWTYRSLKQVLKECFILLSLNIIFITPFLISYHLTLEGIGISFPDHLTSISDLWIGFGPYICLIFLVLLVGQLVHSKITWHPFIKMLMQFALLLTISAECFYLKDMFIDFPTMLTSSHIFMILRFVLGILAAYCILEMWETLQSTFWQDIYFTAVTLIVIPCFVFVPLSLYRSSYDFKPENYGRTDLPTLDGASYLGQANKNLYNTIQFVKKYLPHNAVILTGYVQGYNAELGHIAAFTGRRLLLAIDGDQSFYRGQSILPELQARLEAIRKIYTVPDKRQIVPLLKQYQVHYIYTGPEELFMFGEHAKDFSSIAKEITTLGDTKIYKVLQ